MLMAKIPKLLEDATWGKYRNGKWQNDSKCRETQAVSIIRKEMGGRAYLHWHLGFRGGKAFLASTSLGLFSTMALTLMSFRQ